MNLEFELKRIVENISKEFMADFIIKKFNLDDKDWCWCLKFTNEQENKKDEDKTQNAEAVAVNNEPKKIGKRIPFNKKLKPLVSILHTHTHLTRAKNQPAV